MLPCFRTVSCWHPARVRGPHVPRMGRKEAVDAVRTAASADFGGRDPAGTELCHSCLHRYVHSCSRARELSSLSSPSLLFLHTHCACDSMRERGGKGRLYSMIEMSCSLPGELSGHGGSSPIERARILEIDSAFQDAHAGYWGRFLAVCMHPSHPALPPPQILHSS